MKYAELEFIYQDATHLLRAECETKFTGTVLELFLDGQSVAVSSSSKRYLFYSLPLSEKTFLVAVKISPTGAPSLDLFLDEVSLSDQQTIGRYLETEAAETGKSGKMTMIKNAFLNLLLFTAAGTLVSGISGGFDLSAFLKGLLVSAVITLVFLLWDFLELRSTVKQIQKAGQAPTLLDLSADKELEEEIDESVNPDDVDIPEDSVSFYRQMAKEAEEKEAEEAEPKEKDTSSSGKQ